MMTKVWGSDALGGRKWGSKAVYDDDKEGTVYTDNRARVSKLEINEQG